MALIRIEKPTNFESTSSFESDSAVKDWLNNDGLLNIEKLVALGKKVDAALKKVAVEGKPVGRGGRTVQFDVVGKKTSVSRVLRGRFPRGNAEGVAMDVTEVPRQEGVVSARIQVPAGQTISPKLRAEVAKLLGEVQEVKPTQVIAMSAKAKTAKFTAANDKKKENFTYRSRRAVKVAERTRETATSKTLVRVFPKGILTDALHTQCLDAFKAAQSHIKKIEKVKQGIQKDRDTAKDVKAALYSAVVDEVTPMLESMGIAPSKIVLGKTMMGQQTLYVQLPSKRVITIGLSDVAAMRAAAKFASESSSPVRLSLKAAMEEYLQLLSREGYLSKRDCADVRTAIKSGARISMPIASRIRKGIEELDIIESHEHRSFLMRVEETLNGTK